MIYDVYVGSYMGPNGGDGIYHIKLDTEKQTLSKVASYREDSDNPSFLVVTDDQLYAVSERGDHGYISAFQRDSKTGALSFQNRIEAPGTSMCHLTMWPDGKHLSAANYSSGSLVTCDLAEDGSVGKICMLEQHTGVGFDSTGRQEGPHVHSTTVGPNGKDLYVADLGLDWIGCYEMQQDGTATLKEEAAQVRTPEGEGPRHFVFSEDGKYLYVVTEMGNKLMVYENSGESYLPIQQENLLPEDFDGFNTAADIHFSVDRKFLYGSCRGKNCLTGFKVNPDNGRVELIGFFDSYGDGPRNFCMVPDGKHVLITNQNNGNLVLCPIDAETGIIGSPLDEMQIPMAVFVTAV